MHTLLDRERNAFGGDQQRRQPAGDSRGPALEPLDLADIASRSGSE
jgi:hypothetical protein